MEIIENAINDYINKPTQNFFASLLTKGGNFSKDLIKKVVTKVFQKDLPMDEAVIGFSEGGDIAGYKFHILERESVSYEADVTDHYIDTNRAVHDHIAWKPVTITLQGLQGRYFHDIFKDVSRSVEYYRVFNTVTSFLPVATPIVMARKVKSAISRFTGGSGIINMIANKFTSYAFGYIKDWLRQIGNDLIETYDNAVKIDDEQTKMFLYLETIFKAGMPITVTTSWRSYDNMIITSLKPTRDGNGDITEFQVTLKQISTISSIIVDTNEKVEGGNSANQSAEITDKGTTSGVPQTLPTPATEQEIKDGLKTSAVKINSDDYATIASIEYGFW